jgi:uncharacterized iron-regulated membrane protein
MVAGAKAVRLKRHRKLWLAVHRWIGLGVGLILAIVGLTGSLLVFWQPLDRLLNPALLAPEAGCSPAGHRSLDELVAAARTRVPPEGTLVRVALPETERPLLWAQYAVAVPGADWDDRHDLFVQPCSGAVLGPRLWDTQDRPWTGPLMGVVMRIHTSLLLNQRGLWLGNHILSTSCIVLMISVISGLWLWWPRPGRWRNALSLRLGSSAPRLTYDIHRTVGACSAVLLLMSLFTGLHMYEPWHGFINQAVQAVSAGTRFGTPQAVAERPAGEPRVSAGQAVAAARALHADGQPQSLEMPTVESGAYVVSLATSAVWNTQVIIDAQTGRPLDTRGPHNASAGDSFLNWLFPLHTGRAFGMTGRIVILCLGVLPSVLFVTGVIRWLQKRRGRRVLASRRQQG